MRNCKSFLAVPTGDGPARRARVTARPCEAPPQKAQAGRPCEAPRRKAAGEAEPHTAQAAKPDHTQLEILPCRPQPGTAQRAMRASQRGHANRRRKKRRPDGRAKRHAERREANDCGRQSEAAHRKISEVRNRRICKSFLAVPSRGWPSAPRARCRRQAICRVLPIFVTAAIPAAQDAF